MANPFSDWLEKQSGGAIGMATDMIPRLPAPPNPLDFIPNPMNLIPNDPLGFINNIDVSVHPTTPFSEDSLIREAPRVLTGAGKKKKSTKKETPEERKRAKDPRLNEDGTFKDPTSTARGSIPPEAQWIHTLDNKTYNQGAKSVTSAAGVVLQNSGIRVSDRVALDFRKNAQNIIAQYNKTADPQHKNIADYYVLLTGYLQQLSEADTGPGGGAVVPGATPTEAPVDMSQYPGWNPNSGQQFASAQPGQNPITNRVNQLNTAGTAPPPQQGGMGLAQLLQSISPVNIGMQIGKGIRGG